MNLFLDTTIRILWEKVHALETAFKPITDALDPTKKPEIEMIEKTSTLYPKEVPSPEAFASELDLFIPFCKNACDKDEKALTIRSAAQISLTSYTKYNLFPLTAKAYKLMLSVSLSVCNSDRSFSRWKWLNNYLKSPVFPYFILPFPQISFHSVLYFLQISFHWKLLLLTWIWCMHSIRNV